jgi:lipoprotein-anchoring transpeptidase ErfK/SrfK
MKAVISIFALASGLMVASIMFAAHASSQPLTRSDCDKAGMHWSEEANVCAESNSAATSTESSTAFSVGASQPLTSVDCDKAGMRWNEGANVCVESFSQPLTRADCDRAGLRWNEGANVCSESTSVVWQAETKPESAPGTKGSSILIAIDKAKQKMAVFVDGTKKYDWRVSTGRPGYSTPSGTYSATSMNEVWYSKEWDNAPMPHAIFFVTDGHAIHGSYEVKHLGKPVSHGCVRIAPQNATLLYVLVGKNGLKNTQIVLTGLTPGGEYKVANQASPSRAKTGKPKLANQASPGRTKTGKPKLARVDKPKIMSPGRTVSRYVQTDPNWRGDQPRRRGFFGRLFGGPSNTGPRGYYRRPSTPAY